MGSWLYLHFQKKHELGKRILMSTDSQRKMSVLVPEGIQVTFGELDPNKLISLE